MIFKKIKKKPDHQLYLLICLLQNYNFINIENQVQKKCFGLNYYVKTNKMITFRQIIRSSK